MGQIIHNDSAKPCSNFHSPCCTSRSDSPSRKSVSCTNRSESLSSILRQSARDSPAPRFSCSAVTTIAVGDIFSRVACTWCQGRGSREGRNEQGGEGHGERCVGRLQDKYSKIKYSNIKTQMHKVKWQKVKMWKRQVPKSQKIKKLKCQEVKMIKSQHVKKSNAKSKIAFKSKAQKVKGKKSHH